LCLHASFLTGIGSGLHHHRRHRCDQNGRGNPLCPVPSDVARYLAPPVE
jgi:hypothetical protein